MTMPIASDEDILSGEPRIAGTRIGVRHVGARVIEGEHSPAAAADQLGIFLSAVYEALSYYYDNIAEMREYEQANTTAFEDVRERSLKPKETAE